MDLFALPVELRLKIYSQFLVHPGIINLTILEYLWPTRVWLREDIDLSPAVLRTSKQVYAEAVSLLYSNNCFRFPDDSKEDSGDTTLAFFLGQIGPLARLLRHVCVTLPYRPTSLHQDDVKCLDILRDACPGVTTLTLSLPFTSGVPVSAASLELIDTRLKDLPSLQNVTVDVQWDGGVFVDASDDEDEEAGDDGGVGDWNDPNGCLAAMLRERGWTVQITKIRTDRLVGTNPNEMIWADQMIWTDPNGMIEFRH